ncbi:hypothetical protein Tco_0699770, partial [Tanacetum coccineum]
MAFVTFRHYYLRKRPRNMLQAILLRPVANGPLLPLPRAQSSTIFPFGALVFLRPVPFLANRLVEGCDTSVFLKPREKQADANIALLLLGLLWHVRLMYRYAAPSDTHMFVVHIEHAETMERGKPKIPRLSNPRLETIDTKMKYDMCPGYPVIYGEFEAMMRENIDWRKEPLEGGHGNYATGQSYGVYPHHLYRYSTMNSCGVYAQQYGTAISLAATPVMQRA